MDSVYFAQGSSVSVVDALRDTTPVEGLLLAAALIAGVRAIWGVFGLCRNLVLRRLDEARLLRRLQPGMNIEHFHGQLGHPAFSDVNDQREVHTWPRPLVYIEAVVEGARVVGVALTLRARWFRPWLVRSLSSIPDVRLGSSSFADVSGRPDDVLQVTRGARRHFYVESHYFGNSGAHCSHLFAVNDAGVAFVHGAGGTRARMRFNTFAATAPHRSAESVYGERVPGPDLA